jgi:hypothetical protein
MRAPCSHWLATNYLGSGGGFARLLSAAAGGRSPSSAGIGQLAAHNGARPVAGSLFPNMIGQQDPWLCRLEPVTSNVRSLPQLPTPSFSPQQTSSFNRPYMSGGLHPVAALSPRLRCYTSERSTKSWGLAAGKSAVIPAVPPRLGRESRFFLALPFGEGVVPPAACVGDTLRALPTIKLDAVFLNPLLNAVFFASILCFPL